MHLHHPPRRPGEEELRRLPHRPRDERRQQRGTEPDARVGDHLVEEREEIGVSRQTIKSEVIREPPVQDLSRPIIVEMHVAAAGKEKRRRGQARECDEAHQKDEREDIMAKPRRAPQSAPKIESPGKDVSPGHVNSGTACFFEA